MTQGIAKEVVLFETSVPLEPVAIRAGSKGTKRKAELRKAILRQVSEEQLQGAKEKLRNRIVTLFVVFHLWKGPPTVAETTWTKDVDNLLNVLFDVLGCGAEGLKLIEDDAYICDVQATKKLVTDKANQGYEIKLLEYKDDQMLRSLNESSTKRRGIAH
jgi:Holliday junction resolvase RusA-like endonuclease